jgi:hypothetical protein
MERIAPKAALFDEVISRFGDARGTVNKLNQIGSRTAQADRELLAKLGEETGNDFVSAVQQYSTAQATLKDPRAMEQIKRGLPQFPVSQQAEKSSALISRPETIKGFRESQVGKEGLREKLAQAQQRFSKTGEALTQAQETLEPIKRLGPGSTQSVIKSMLGAEQNIEAKKSLEQLSKLSDTDFMQLINDLRTNKALASEFRNGARNAVIGSMMGFLLGGGDIGAAASGAVAGGAVDRFGPAVAKRILDGYLKVSASPSMQTISALKIPDEAKQFIARSLVLGSARTGATLRDTAEERRLKQLQNRGQ